MLRILITLGSVILEVLTTMTEGAMAISMILAGMIITAVHLTADSATFQRIVNRLTGFDLPESLEPFASSPVTSVEDPVARRSGDA